MVLIQRPSTHMARQRRESRRGFIHHFFISTLLEQLGLLLLGLSLCADSIEGANSATVYISRTGNNGNTGSTPADPKQTFTAAASDLLSKVQLGTNDLTIIALPGLYPSENLLIELPDGVSFTIKGSTGNFADVIVDCSIGSINNNASVGTPNVTSDSNNRTFVTVEGLGGTFTIDSMGVQNCVSGAATINNVLNVNVVNTQWLSNGPAISYVSYQDKYLRAPTNPTSNAGLM